MWRAWGILLFLHAQDLGPSAPNEEHEITLRPPAGWVHKVASGATFARFSPPDVAPTTIDGEQRMPPWGITLRHISYGAHPTPLEALVKQAKAHIAKEYKNPKFLEEKALKIGGRSAFRLVYEFENVVQINTLVPRTNLEAYLLDLSFPKAEEAKYRKVAEASLDTFQIVPAGLTGEEVAADVRTAEVFKTDRVRPGLLGEQWHLIHFGDRKVGYTRTKLEDSGGAYRFEIDVRTDYGEGNLDSTTVRGSFSPDGRTQKLDSETSIANDKKEHWLFRASASIEAGRYKSARDMNGVKEEKSFPVEEGVLLGDVAQFLRRALVATGKGTWLLKTISPYADEWKAETVEVSEKAPLELDGARRDAVAVFSRVGRRHMTYYFAPEGTLIREGGVKDAFTIRVSTKESALGAGNGK